MKSSSEILSASQPLQVLQLSLQTTIQSLQKDRAEVEPYFQSIGTHTDEVLENIKQVKVCLIQTGQYLQKNKRTSREPILRKIFSFLIPIIDDKKVQDITDEKKKAIKYIEIQSKMSVVPSFLKTAIDMKPDIATQKLQNFPQVMQRVQIIKNNVDQKLKIEEQSKELDKMMRVIISSVITEKKSDFCFFQKIVFGVSFIRFMIAEDQSLLRCYSLWRKPNIEMVLNFWDLPEQGAIKHLQSFTYPQIKTSFYIHIPTKPKDSHELGGYNIFQSNQEEQTIQVLVLHYEDLEYRDKRYQPSTCCKGTNLSQIQTIIIHLHGGGFVALSSASEQSYTRRWANDVKVPVFSIDYRKAPTHRFPIAINDSFAAYEFIVSYIQNYFNIKPKRIILAGQSAGGNLACSLEALILKKKIVPRPIGMFLAYPALDTRQIYTPSRLNTFNDTNLFPTLLLTCLKQYLGEDKNTQFNPLASPILLNESFIKGDYDVQDDRWPLQWPHTIIATGKKDPLYDDSLKLIEKLRKANIDGKLISYEDFSHGFLSLDKVISQCQQTIKTSIEELKKLASLKE